MMKKIFWIIPFFLYIFILCLVNRHVFKNNKYFSLHLIFPQWNSIPQFTTPVQEVFSFFTQPYYYFAKGNQSFVFISKDQKTIVKFLRLPKEMRTFSLRRKCIKNSSKQTVLNCKTASSELREETGILYAHFQPTNTLKQKIIIFDHLGSSYNLELDNLPFMLQKKAEPFFATFKALCFEDAQKVIKHILELYLQLYQKQYIDHDPIFEKNLGLIGLQPILMDFGQIEKCNYLPPKTPYLLQMTNSLRIQLEKDSPKLLQYYFSILEEMQ